MLETRTIWNEYREALRAFLSRRVANQADVDELLQDILLKTHQQLPKLRDEENIRAWLFRIARNVTIDHYRTKGRKESINPGDLWYEQEMSDATHDLERCVEPFINNLPPKYAELLRAVDLRGIAQKDYAAQLGISYSTLKSRVQSARKKLHSNFTECCNFELDHSGAVIDYQEKSGSCDDC